MMMDSLAIDARKAWLKDKIYKAIYDFEEKTGKKVTEVVVNRFEETPYLTSVKVRII